MIGKTDIEIVFRNHYKDFLNYAYTFTSDVHDAEEIVQEAFLSVWELRDKINKTSAKNSTAFSAVNKLRI